MQNKLLSRSPLSALPPLSRRHNLTRPHLSLSRYFPKGSAYFYGYPSGAESGFFNSVPPVIEELVAARPLVCAGDDIKIITYAAAIDPTVWDIMTNELGIKLIKNIIALPKTITSEIKGKERNKLIKKALKEIVAKEQLIMAQPFLDGDLLEHYKINPNLTIYLNDKKNMSDYIPEEYLPKKYANFRSGQLFESSTIALPIPCVVKISSSSSGDGVKICLTKEDLAAAKNEFSLCDETIYVEEYITVKHNLGIQFGISANQDLIEIIGFNEQLTTAHGQFIGGIIDPQAHFPEMDQINGLIINQILPKIKKMGWYGIGGFDVLVTDTGKFFFIDCNFRMTGMTAFIFKSRNRELEKPVMTFTGKFYGSEKKFREKIIPLAKGDNKIMDIIALTRRGESFRFNAGLLYDNEETLKKNVKILLQAGIESKVFDIISSPKRP